MVQAAALAIKINTCVAPPVLSDEQARAALLAAERCTRATHDWLSTVASASLTPGAQSWLDDLSARVDAKVAQSAIDSAQALADCEAARYPQPNPTTPGVHVALATRLKTATTPGGTSTSTGIQRASCNVSVSPMAVDPNNPDNPDKCPPLKTEIVYDVDHIIIPPDIPVDIPVDPDNGDGPDDTVVYISSNISVTTYPRKNWRLYIDDAFGDGTWAPVIGEATYLNPDSAITSVPALITRHLYGIWDFPASQLVLPYARVAMSPLPAMVPPPHITYEPLTYHLYQPGSFVVYSFITVTLLVEYQSPNYSFSQVFQVTRQLELPDAGSDAQDVGIEYDFFDALKQDPAYLVFANAAAASATVPGLYKMYIGIRGVSAARLSMHAVSSLPKLDIFQINWRQDGGMLVAHTHYKDVPPVDTYERTYVFQVYDIAVTVPSFVHTTAATEVLTLSLLKTIINGHGLEVDAAVMVQWRTSPDYAVQIYTGLITKAEAGKTVNIDLGDPSHAPQVVTINVWFQVAEYKSGLADAQGNVSMVTHTDIPLTYGYQRLAYTTQITTRCRK